MYKIPNVISGTFQMLSKLLLCFFSIVVINNCCRNRGQLMVGYPTLKDTSATQLLPLKLGNIMEEGVG